MTRTYWTVEDLMEELQKYPKNATVLFADWAVIEKAKATKGTFVEDNTVHSVEMMPESVHENAVLIQTTGVVRFEPAIGGGHEAAIGATVRGNKGKAVRRVASIPVGRTV